MNDLRPLAPKDLDDLKVDPAGNLYWRGREVRTGGWTTADRIALAAAAVSVLTLLASILKDYPGIREGWGRLTGSAPEAVVPAAAPLPATVQ